MIEMRWREATPKDDHTVMLSEFNAVLQYRERYEGSLGKSEFTEWQDVELAK